MEFLLDYLGFLAKTATVVVAALIVLSAITAASMHRAMRKPPAGQIELSLMNDRLRDMARLIDQATASPRAVKKERKREAKEHKQEQKQRDREPEERRRVFVLTFDGDVQASAVDKLRREITAILIAARDSDEVVVRIDSAGGMVHAYGLAASQLARIRGRGLSLTSTIDKVAASGGYLMAAVADRVLAAPFAVVGSIGVLAQVPNVHRLLKEHKVDVDVLTAGRHKRTLDFLGENTEQGRQKLKEELDDVHALFQEFVAQWRPALEIEAVATGEAWYGQRAVSRSLVDELITSDEYLARACDDADVFEVTWVQPKKPIEQFVGQLATAVNKGVGQLMDRTLGGIR